MSKQNRNVALEGRPSVGKAAEPLVRSLVQEAAALRVAVTRAPGGAQLIDAGIAVPGSLEAGRRIAEICMGGIGWVASGRPLEPRRLAVCVGCLDRRSRARLPRQPVCRLAAQPRRGRWCLVRHGLGAGPGARGQGGAVRASWAISTRSETACFVLETDRSPPDGLVARVADDCGLPAEALTFILTPTSSLAGIVQITARVLEVAPAQGACAGLPDRPGARRAGPRTPAAAGARHAGRHGPHQRRHPVRRRGPAVRRRPRGRGARARARSAELGLARLRQAVRRAVRGGRPRLLQDRPDAVQPGPGARDRPRDAAARFRGGRLAPDLLARSFGDEPAT